jgi:hypothetical protein
MTRKVYKTAMGKAVDLGALLLQNENVRSVGNMGVNAAGDLVDSTNRVIDQRNRQVQKQYRKQTNVSAMPATTSNVQARKVQAQAQAQAEDQQNITEPDQFDFDETIESLISQPQPQPEPQTISQPTSGGLAAAIARSREVKQELEKTLRQKTQEQGVRKL